MIRTVVVTGASGFVGTPLVRHLVARGLTVRVLAKRPFDEPGVTVFRASAEDAGEEDRALAGADAIVHAAARVHVVHERHADPVRAFHEVNVAWTLRLAQAAVRHRVSHFVFLSTAHVMGTHSVRPFDEDDAVAPATTYAVSKLEAERAAAACLVGSDTVFTALRPPLVYGPGVKANFLSLIKMVAAGVPLPFKHVRNARSYVAIENLVAAIDTILEQGAKAQGPLFVSDGEDLSTADLIRLMASGLGRSPRLVGVPDSMLRFAARVGDVLAPVAPVPLDSRRLVQLTGDLQLSVRRLAHLGFAPVVSPADAVVRTAQWVRGAP